MTTYAIPRRNTYQLDTTVARLNRRAERLGVEPLRYEYTGAEWCDFERKFDRASGESRVRGWEVVEIELEGGSIHLPGWTFAGTIEHLDGENVLRAAPEQSIPESYRDAAKVCDHCGLDRQRIDTFVVVSDAGEYKQLGRSCTADYLGSVDPQRLASWLEAVHALLASEGDEDGDEHGPRQHMTYRPDEIVAIANGAIRAFGFIKSAEAGSTKGTVGTWMGGGSAQRKLEERGMEVTAEDYEAAEKMVAWAAEQGRENDYIANLAAYARQERVDDRAMGLLASLPTAYGRAMGQIAERKAREEKRAAEREDAQPAPSGRQVVEGIIVGRKEQENDYGRYGGVTIKVALLTAAGWRLWVTLPAAIEDAQIGDTVRLTAAVQPSEDDPTFAFGSRPSKASIIERAAAEEEAAAPAADPDVCPKNGRAHAWIERTEGGEDAGCYFCDATTAWSALTDFARDDARNMGQAVRLAREEQKEACSV